MSENVDWEALQEEVHRRWPTTPAKDADANHVETTDAYQAGILSGIRQERERLRRNVEWYRTQVEKARQGVAYWKSEEKEFHEQWQHEIEQSGKLRLELAKERSRLTLRQERAGHEAALQDLQAEREKVKRLRTVLEHLQSSTNCDCGEWPSGTITADDCAWHQITAALAANAGSVLEERTNASSD